MKTQLPPAPPSPVLQSAPMTQRPSVLFVAGLPDDRRVVVEGMDQAGGIREFTVPGVANFHGKLPLAGIDKQLVFLRPDRDQQLQLRPPGLVFNLISDPDVSARALARAETLVGHLGRPAINAPAAVRPLTRDQTAARLAGIPGLVAPRALRFSPTSRRDVEAAIDAHGLTFPLLFRAAGAHDGRGLVRLRDWGELERLDRFALDGRPHYLTEFVDYRDDDGLFRKCRFVCVGGAVLPRHLFISDHWKINTEAGYFAEHPALHAEERAFLAGFADHLSPLCREALRELPARLGLDVFGVDGSLRPDGSILIFEASPAMKILEPPESFPEGFRYRLPYVRQITEAIETLVHARMRPETGHGAAVSPAPNSR